MVDNIEEKLGWPSLECQLSFYDFSEKLLMNVCDIVLKKLSLTSKNPFSAGTEDYEYIYGDNLNVFIDNISKLKYVLATINFEGVIYDVESRFSVQFEPEEKVLSLVVREDFIFKYTDDMSLANVERLMCFFDLCKEISQICKPVFGVLSLEHYMAEEVSVINAESNGIKLFSEEMFSRKVAESWVKQYHEEAEYYNNLKK